MKRAIRTNVMDDWIVIKLAEHIPVHVGQQMADKLDEIDEMVGTELIEYEASNAGDVSHELLKPNTSFLDSREMEVIYEP